MVRHLVTPVLLALSTLAPCAMAQASPPVEDAPPAVDAPPPETAAPPQTPVPPPPAAAPATDPPPPPTATPAQPLALPPPEPAAPVAPSRAPATVPSPTDQPVDAQLYGGIVISGVGAALLVVAGIAMSRIEALQEEPGFVAYRDGFASHQDVCEEARAGVGVDGASSPAEVSDLCDEATRWEITSYVAVPGGIALLGMGLYLTLTSETAQIESPVALVPLLGPSTAGLTVAGRF